MAYIYRYIDLCKQEVCYIGKVTKDGIDNLYKRHSQHKRESWYLERGGVENIVCQYIETKTHADADIFETYLISFYDTGQLENRAKTGWGKPSIDLFDEIFGRWRCLSRRERRDGLRDEVAALVAMIDKESEGLLYNVEGCLNMFNARIRELAKEINASYRLSRMEEQSDFLRYVPRSVKEATHDRH